MRSHALQRMLDFDFLCHRDTPSVAAIIHPGARSTVQTAFFGAAEISIPVFRSLSEAVVAFPTADVLINYATRAAIFQSSLIAINTKSIRTVVITSEGMPENDARRLLAAATRNNKAVIGPGTVGGIQAGAFKIGDTAGTAENVLMCKLYRPGSVGVVCKSSGILNELCYILARVTDGLYEGIVVGADRYACSTLLEHALRLQQIDAVKFIVAIGEPGGMDEYELAAAVKSGALRKPLVSWVLGQCGRYVPGDLRYGRVNTSCTTQPESAHAKLAALRAAGILVPDSFDQLPDTISRIYKSLVEAGQLVPAPDNPVQFTQHPPSQTGALASDTTTASTTSAVSSIQPLVAAAAAVPQRLQPSRSAQRPRASRQHATAVPSYRAQQAMFQQQQPPPPPSSTATASKPQPQQSPRSAAAAAAAKRRTTTGIVSSICDDRGDEPAYCGIPLSQFVIEEAGVGDTIALLWFKRRVPRWASRFLELVITVLADKGPCACAAHASIVASRAGKDIVSCMCSGLLTVGPRYGGGSDESARCFLLAIDSGLPPEDFVEKMRRDGVVIRGIGGPTALTQFATPDRRATLLREYALRSFPTHKFLDFALEVEKITSAKARNLILNLDGVLGALFLDLMDGCPAFTSEEMRELVSFGCLGALFAFSRSIGIVGHAIDQKRLKQPLYRHAYDDVTYVQQNLL